MNNTALREAEKHILFHHKGSDGWITMAKKDAETNRFMQRHYKAEELADHLSEWMGEDVFFSQGTFYRPQRRIDTIRQLRSLYVDIDVYTKGLSADWVLQKLEYEVFGKDLPDPNMIIFSGRGLVLIWNIDPIPYMAIPLWRSVEQYFVKRLKDLGADPKATDPARIFRIAGSINSKNGAVVKAQYRHEYRYDIHQIQYDYLPELSPKRMQQKKPGRKKKVVWLYNLYTLHLARARDIAKIVELRHGYVGKCREHICFLYRYFTCCYTDDPQKALQDTLSLNAEFTHPLSEQEVIRATKSAQKAWEARNNKEANEAAKSMGYPGAGYNIKNTSLIDWLLITEDEMKELSTIISSKEKRRRKNIADRIAKEQQRREAGIRTQAQYAEDRRKKADNKAEAIKEVLLNNPQITNAALAKETGIPRSTVIRLRKTIAL